MNKSIWLITHDSYIDRRIFFFAEVFMSMGFTVKLFPYYYFDLTNDFDPHYVCRPVEEEIVCQNNLNIEDIDEDIQSLILKIKTSQELYKEKHGKYSKTMRRLKIIVPKGTEVSLIAFKEFYLVSIKTERRIIFNSLTNKLQLVNLSYGLLKIAEYEKAMFEYIRNGDNGTVGYYGINVRKELDEFGSKQFYFHNPALNSMYTYNSESHEMTCQKPLALDSCKLDMMNNETFDFSDFKEVLFDYSSILKRIKQELMVETPYMVYVADLPTLPIGVMLKRVLDCKLMVDCHEWWHKQEHLWSANMPNREIVSKKYEALLYKECDICITVGKLLMKDMGECYGKPFETIYSCVSKSLSDCVPEKSRNAILKELSIDANSKIAIFQGGMTTLRNLDNLARATKCLDENCYLLLIGSGPYEQKFREILNKEGNPERVRFIGWVNQKNLSQYTMCADLGVLPYHKVDEYFSYSVPNKLMEYFDLMLPMLHDSTMAEISMVAAENGVGVAANLADPEEFGRVMNNLLQDTAKLHMLKTNYQKCKDKFKFFSQEQELKRIMNCYLQLSTL